VIEPVLTRTAALADEQAHTPTGNHRTLLANFADASHALRTLGVPARRLTSESQNHRAQARNNEPDQQRPAASPT
jgi:hypothetical protein